MFTRDGIRREATERSIDRLARRAVFQVRRLGNWLVRFKLQGGKRSPRDRQGGGSGAKPKWRSLERGRLWICCHVGQRPWAAEDACCACAGSPTGSGSALRQVLRRLAPTGRIGGPLSPTCSLQRREAAELVPKSAANLEPSQIDVLKNLAFVRVAGRYGNVAPSSACGLPGPVAAAVGVWSSWKRRC
jgi:hypothetical protein